MHLVKTSSDPILKITDLSVRYPGRSGLVPVLNDVSIDVEPNEIFAVVGESGSGKSTLARAIVGMVPQLSGTITLQGAVLPTQASRRTLEQRRKIGMVFQDNSSAFDPRYTVEQILMEPIRILGRNATSTGPGQMLDIVGLPSAVLGKRARELSGGQRQRVGIARALAASPRVLICDEAVSALDVSVQAQILNVLSDIQRERDLAIIFITHDLSVVGYLADRVGVLSRGQLVEVGEAADILDRPTHAYTRQLVRAVS